MELAWSQWAPGTCEDSIGSRDALQQSPLLGGNETAAQCSRLLTTEPSLVFLFSQALKKRLCCRDRVQLKTRVPRGFICTYDARKRSLSLIDK